MDIFLFIIFSTYFTTTMRHIKKRIVNAGQVEMVTNIGVKRFSKHIKVVCHA